LTVTSCVPNETLNPIHLSFGIKRVANRFVC